MGEMAQAETEVYATRSVQVWKTVLNWLAFFFHIFLQIVRGTPSLAQVFSYIGLGHQSLLPSDSSSFKPLPVVELPESPESAAALEITAGALAVPDESDHLPIQRLTVVLDLDETLVCAYETSSLPAIVHHQATEAGLKWFELDCLSSEKDREGKPKVNHVTVFERPGLGEFLKQLSEFADLVLFTAGLEGYARPLVDRIDFDNRFSHRLYRPSTISTGGMGMCFSIPLTGTACVAVNLIGMKPGTPFLRDACTDAGLPLFCILKKDNLDAGHYQLVFQMKWNMESFVLDFFRNNTYREYREHVKDLSCLSKNLCRTVIVDNNPFSFLLQPMNGIPCVPFSAGQPQDDQLLEVILPLLRHLAQQKDVRPILYEKFHMPEWFQKHGIPSSSWTK